ncbi:16S rRNA (cytidine(1402)-2'-O)-methyltransferase [Helicobacter aurati]|uniref:16S rRNA (Cytidine(1402)-2'-O)-methyltransferase n=1 Tax=Helicobacter aurati TaxID=137778 RepID=A0A3D8IYH2_9HELI|nr:16S rRNA (cytidine(1402)-2'-O)-methyltransferase [Helicobacter aurati]RDU70308.1 16S rRNA (cytidine(1402)-2'-O)-methyltransferase [Helicobacter aurati]
MLLFVPTPLGNIEDISLRVLQAFHQAEIILCEDTRVTKKLLHLLAQKAIIQQYFPHINSINKQFISFHSHNQREFLSTVTPKFFNAFVVCCSDAGMPCINDPGELLIDYARKNQIQYEVLPGGSAFNLAFACSGLQGAFCFFGFLPHKMQERTQKLKNILAYHKDFHLIFYESPKRLKACLQDISLILPNAILYLYKELTKLYQCEYKGNAEAILAKLPSTIRGEYCIIIAQDCQSKDSQKLCLSQEDILLLPTNIKQKAKMLAQISEYTPKQWYAKLLEQQSHFDN